MGYIYLIRNLVNGKGYVGQTETSIARRWCGHKSSARRGSRLILHTAIRKYGVENFTVKEVVRCDSLLLNDLETHYIKFYGSVMTGHGYNMSEGGQFPPNHRGFKRSAKTIERLTASANNREPLSAEARSKISSTKKLLGHAPSAAAREKARLLLTGVPISPHVTAAAVAALTGTKKSPEELARRSATRRANAAKRLKMENNG